MRVATIGETGYRESTDMSGVPSSSRTITDMIELSSSLPQTVSHFTVLLVFLLPLILCLLFFC